jgi:uncharacterized membrane protein YfcA
VPAIPDHIGNIGNVEISKGVFLMIVFAVLMLVASYSMIKGGDFLKKEGKKESPFLLVFYGFLIGTLTGLVGAGGGFVIIPALVFMGGLLMKEAVGTSLLIIACNALFGFAGDIGNYETDWSLILVITVIAVTGIIVGHRISRKFASTKLKKGFGWFILCIGLFIIVNELVIK